VPHQNPILITFARPEESRAFRRSLTDLRREKLGGFEVWHGALNATAVVVLHTGIGPAAAATATDAVIRTMSPIRLIAAGFAGGLNPVLQKGDIIRESPANYQFRRIATRSTPAETPNQKAALRRETGAEVIDMETAAIAEQCKTRQVPMTAVRIVSDTAAEPLAVPFEIWYNLTKQKPRPIRLLTWLAMHPRHIIPFYTFVVSLPKLAEALAEALHTETQKNDASPQSTVINQES
jgi:nucleoside phosphorylase